MIICNRILFTRHIITSVMFIGCYGYKSWESCFIYAYFIHKEALCGFRCLAGKLVTGSKVIGVIVRDSLCSVRVTFRKHPYQVNSIVALGYIRERETAFEAIGWLSMSCHPSTERTSDILSARRALIFRGHFLLDTKWTYTLTGLTQQTVPLGGQAVPAHTV